MKKIYSLALSFLLLLAIPALAAGFSDSPWVELEGRRREVARRMEAATVWVVVDNGNEWSVGTGFIVADGYIVTNAHVTDALGRRASIHILNEKIPVRAATLINSVFENFDEGGWDFALLRFDPPRGAELPVLYFNVDVQRMDRVSSWGYPLLATQFDIRTDRLERGDFQRLEAPPVIFTEGTVSAIVRGRIGDSILHSASIAGGNSGGPLVNSRGEVVGMNTWGATGDDGGAYLNAAQLASEITTFLSENGITPRLVISQQVAAAQPRQEPPPAAQDDRRRGIGDFTVLIPHGWSVIDEQHNEIIVGADDDSAAVAILAVDMESLSLRQVALDLSRELGGTRPELDDGLYVFTFSEDGIDSMAFVAEGDYEYQYVIIFISGDFGNSGVYEVLNSVE